MTANQVAYQRQREEARANAARESEAQRANRAIENLRLRELEEAQRHNQLTEQEQLRANLAREQEANRSNLAKELEAATHNRASEQIGAYQVSASQQLGYANLAELSRSNLEKEANSRYATSTQQTNTVLTNAANKQIAAMRETEQNRRHAQDLAQRRDEALMNAGTDLAASFSRFIGGLFGGKKNGTKLK